MVIGIGMGSPPSMRKDGASPQLAPPFKVDKPYVHVQGSACRDNAYRGKHVILLLDKERH